MRVRNIVGRSVLAAWMVAMGASAAMLEANTVRIHYYRTDGNYGNWSLYTFKDTGEPDDFRDGPVLVSGTDEFGAYFDAKIRAGAQDLGFIVHNLSSGAKDPGPDMHVDVSRFQEAWVVSGDQTVYTAKPTAAQILGDGLTQLQAYWIDRGTIAIGAEHAQAGWTYELVYSPDAKLQITDAFAMGGGEAIPLSAAGNLSSAQLERNPQLSGYQALHLPEGANVKAILKGQALLAGFGGGRLKYVTGLQTAGVLDDLFYYAGKLGVAYGNRIDVRLWAPTAASVELLLFRGAQDAEPDATVTMKESDGVWQGEIENSWGGGYYLFRVKVYVPSLRAIVTNIVTDPYSVDLALNGVKSRFTDLRDADSKPRGWDEHRSPALDSVSDLTIWELHVRDFSVDDASVPAEHRGTYLAFTDRDSNGMRHLDRLAKAGMKAVHLLPTFHIASVDEDKSKWKSPGDLSSYAPDSAEQQAAVVKVQNEDGYNWGYDPVHYMTPEGSYAMNPEARVKEYRAMVESLHAVGLRVIQDQVFNHTSANGQAENSVLDRVVPNYYYRLDRDGKVFNNSCCPDTASERRMMEKLMVDTLVQNAREYKIDGFRFDLMSFHFVYNLEHIKQALAQLTLERDGVDGSKIYLYGEGWSMGETANHAFGPEASQGNLYGTGVGTFNDRIRDAVRGGGAFADQREQGFATGLYTAPNAYMSGRADQRMILMKESDWLQAGLAGNLREFRFMASSGAMVAAGDLDYGGQKTGYAATPVETINYCSAHDNQTLFDAIQLKAAASDDIATRTRRQVLALSLIALSEGIPFFHAGDELLRSKDMDNNSYNSGDWFNRIDFTYKTNHWGMGLPPATDNQANWAIMKPLLADAKLKAGGAEIAFTRDWFEALLKVRASSELFRMRTLADVQKNLQFFNTGPRQIPGVIAMRLGEARGMVVVFNATATNISLQDDALKGRKLGLHPALLQLNDPALKSAKFNSTSGTVEAPALTTVVFVD